MSNDAHVPRVGVICHFPPPPGGMPVQAEAIVNGLTSEGVPVVRIPTNLRGSRLDRARFLRTFLRGPAFLVRLLCALPRVDVLHVNTCSGIYFFLFGATSILLGRAAGKRIVLHYHSGNAPAFFAKCRPAIRWLLGRVHEIVVPSNYLGGVFADMGFPSRVIPNICDLDRFSRAPLPLSPVFVVARNLEPIYGVDTILHAFSSVRARYPHAKLIILGSGTQRVSLAALAERLGIAGAVTFTGYIENARIPDVFSTAAIFVNASLSDNQPVSILEAFAAGLPVISSEVGGIPCLVRHGETGLLVPPQNAEALADAMIAMLTTPDLATRCVQHARRFVQDYSWTAVYTRLKQVYGQ
jgi:glycosyltransferase involved in cell wall biosynthesis